MLARVTRATVQVVTHEHGRKARRAHRAILAAHVADGRVAVDKGLGYAFKCSAYSFFLIITPCLLSPS
jgi:hypothetical protein